MTTAHPRLLPSAKSAIGVSALPHPINDRLARPVADQHHFLETAA